jgi:ATP-dependent Clp protease ATP-binding subunit ClpC
MNGYNFTERVRSVLGIARQVAAETRSESVDTAQILVALIRDGGGVGFAMLKLAGDTNALEQRTLARLPAGDRAGASTAADLPYTSPAKKVIELAMVEARDGHFTYVGTEHLLLGLIRQERGIAAQVLRESGVELVRAREEMHRLLGHSESAQPDEFRAPMGSRPGAARRAQCPDCGVPMEPGHLPDKAGPSNAVTKWVRGAPADKPGAKSFDVVAYRCPNCGLIRLYT